jgi:hypothetical protein
MQKGRLQPKFFATVTKQQQNNAFCIRKFREAAVIFCF